MIINHTDMYIKTCMKTWLLCESCVHNESDGTYRRNQLVEKCRECANSCFAVVCRMISVSEWLEEAVLTCVLACKNCYEECARYEGSADIEYCGEVCRLCGELLKRDLMLPAHLN